MNRLGLLLLNPFIIGLFISFIIIFLLPPIFDKYKIEPVNNYYRYDSKVYYNDLNNDSYSEFICLHYSSNEGPNVSIFNAPAIQIDNSCSAVQYSVTIDQFNFTRKWLRTQNLGFGDYDNNGLKEIYFYTYSHDSLFLQGLDPYHENLFFTEIFLGKINYRNNLPDMILQKEFLFSDLNHDGYNEVIGSIIGAYSAMPRFIFAYDIHNQTLMKSNTGCINLSITSIKADDKGNAYLAGADYAPGNADDSLTTQGKFSDLSSWLVVLDKNLNFAFPPVEFPGFTSSIVSYLKKENNGLFVYARCRPPRGKGSIKIKKFNIEGVEVTSKDFSDLRDRNFVLKSESKRDVLYLYEILTKTLYRVKENLDLKKSANFILPKIIMFDLDLDGSDEIFNWEEGGEYAYIYQSDFSNPAKVSMQSFYPGFILSPCRFKDNSANFVIYSNNIVHYFKFFKNPFYYLKYPIYIGIYLLVSLLLYLIMFFQKRSLQKKFEQEKKMTELELLTIKNQMDPHFTFNAINTASYMVYNKDKKTAYQFLVNFSNLIRNVLQKSKDISVSLSDEIEFVKNYLVLQQYRHDFAFEYEVKLKGNIDQQIAVPKMIIQTFAENAIKHGLSHKKSGGKLDIMISDENEKIKISIEDNGIGRIASKQMLSSQKISTGKGHDIINQIIALFNKLKETKVTYSIIDLYTEKEPSGTRVEILIPKKLAHND